MAKKVTFKKTTVSKTKKAPSSKTSKKKSPQSKSTSSKGTSKTILVVDDEKDIRDSVKTILTKEGYQVKTATSADDCLKKLKTINPDLILLDIMMPGTPVREVVPKIKQKIAFCSVVRTSEAEKESILGAKNIVDFIQKPFDIKDLVKRVKKIVKD